ncbi:zinc ribbon domain-containing protein [Hoeflea sp. TYP-13]|uniref:zinc ribbon domain-containing protein n=1 Tax=Hoeflea sp. TYP-13 TaxID=3230023 RepID=UPI0034C624DD
MKHRLTLEYTLGAGALEPYLNGLREGKSIARQCRRCDRVTFPPERACGCQSSDNLAGSYGWKQLAGTAALVHRTDGSGGSFALVRFDGADNQAVCRIANPVMEGEHARLLAVHDGAPGLLIELTGEALETAG